MKKYSYKNSAGQEFGALPFHTLQMLFSSGTITTKTLIRREDETEWRPAGFIFATSSPPVPSPQAPKPNQAGRIVFFGLLAWIIGIVGLMALGQGMDNLEKIKRGEMTKGGKGLIIFGMISGVLGLVANVSVLIARCSSGSL